MNARVVGAALLLALAGCSTGGGPDQAPPGELVRSTKARVTTPVPAEDTKELTKSNSGFAFDMLRQAAKGDNFFFSPESLSMALAMTYGGARETTAQEMAHALHFSLPDDRLHATFGALDLALAERSAKPVESGQPFQLNIVNSVWGQRGYAFLPSYLDLLAEHYGAGLSLLDFASDPEGARSAINRWVSDRTATRIPELVPPGVITPATVLVLSNAIYFNASWEVPFEPRDTTDGVFRRFDGSATTAHLMHQTKEHRYTEGHGWQALELLYAGADVSMLVILPARGRFEEVREELDAWGLSAVVAALSTRSVVVALPRFQFRTSVRVKPALQAMGMKQAFVGGAADFSGMDGTKSLFLQDVVHEAYVSVDERGTEAAAATAVVVGRLSAPEPATFDADRPFLFLVRDNLTGAVLFLGQVTEP